MTHGKSIFFQQQTPQARPCDRRRAGDDRVAEDGHRSRRVRGPDGPHRHARRGNLQAVAARRRRHRPHAAGPRRRRAAAPAEGNRSLAGDHRHQRPGHDRPRGRSGAGGRVLLPRKAGESGRADGHAPAARSTGRRSAPSISSSRNRFAASTASRTSSARARR